MAAERREHDRLNGHAVAPERAAPELPAPYPGLSTFQTSDAARFFGRSSECRLVVANLRAARVTVVHGPSGVGKSSLLYAGVIPALQALDPPPPLVVASRWDESAPAVLGRDIARSLGATVADDGLPGAAVRALEEHRGEAPVLILDQFEDLLRHPASPALHVVEYMLGEITGGYGLLARVLIAVREDQLAGLDRLEGAVPGMFGNVFRLEPLSRDGAREAIEGPLERWNLLAREHAAHPVALESGLAEQVLDELAALSRDRDGTGGPQRIAPPLLALTMRRLWDTDVGAGGTTLRRATLRALGGAGRILATHLDATLDALPAREQRLAADMFRYLVTPSGASRPLTAKDLARYTDTEQPAIEALAETLARPPARILTVTSGGAHTEYLLAHDVLAEPASEWEARYRTRRLEATTRRLMLAVLAVAVTALGLIVQALAPGPVSRLELRTVDARFAVRGAEPAGSGIVIVTEGDAEYRALHYPTDTARAAYARAIARIATARARVIALDIFFDTAKSAAGDRALITAVGRYGDRVVLGADMLDNRGEVTAFGRSDQTFSDTSAPAVGYVGFPGNPNDPHAVVRKMERGVALPGGSPLETFAVVVARVAGVPRRDIRRMPGTTWIDFRGGAGTYPTVPMSAVLAGSPRALAALRGRIVLLGITAAVKHDIHDTAAPGRSVMAGTELQANAVWTALRRFPLRSTGTPFDLGLIAVVGLLPLLLTQRLRARGCLAATLALALAFVVGVQLAFAGGWVVEVVVPLGTLLVSGLAVSAAIASAEGRRRARRARASGSGESGAAPSVTGPVPEGRLAAPLAG